MDILKNRNSLTTIISTGLALFAMFFGAGNMIFPLQLGITSGQHLITSIIGFIITGVGFPFLGLFTVSLYEGNYWSFFGILTKPLAFLVITFLVMIICYTVGAPRTELVVYDTLSDNFSFLHHYAVLFSFLYFLIVFFIVYKPSRIIDIIGWFLSPIKILTFITLIASCFYFAKPLIHTTHSSFFVFKNAIVTGYGTMDLLAAIFFCSIAYKNILRKCEASSITDKKTITHITILSCCISAFLIGLIYAGFIVSAAFHANALSHTITSALVGKIAAITLGEYGFIFVAICVSFACIATASALAEVGSDFLYQTLLQKRIPKIICLIITLICMFASSLFGFVKIMAFAIPILTVLYPALIVLCLVNIVKANLKSGI